MVSDVAFKPLHPYSEDIAKYIPKIPLVPVGFEYFTGVNELIAQNSTKTASRTYTVPKNKILFITDLHLSLYMDNFSTSGLLGKGYFHVKTNDAVFSYIAMLMIKGNRMGTTGGDSSDHLSLNFPMPLRIPSGTVITFLASKSSGVKNSIVWGYCCMHGYLLKK